jgi:hypothetical protein
MVRSCISKFHKRRDSNRKIKSDNCHGYRTLGRWWYGTNLRSQSQFVPVTVHFSVQLILTLLFIICGHNRIFRHTKSDTVNRHSRNNGPDPLFFEETNTGSFE